ncbi:MAG: glutamine-hydrolyzing carbamoyl-phosphate synthase small subunit [Fibrobacter sp.]|jgi:carbamoyl-phosphate synthase small subunit|nr:glutamine-hydrolyzing carbamoyl-phosphate synthase small subunit [Fibrobacter sp.]
MTLQEKWKSERERKAYLALADGSVFYGYSVGAPADALGEVVFNTGLSGFEEMVTDPALAGKLVLCVASEVGNAGMNVTDMESEKIQVAGLMLSELNKDSNWRSEKSFQEALVQDNVPAIAGIDTRALTLHLRENGAQRGFICTSGSVAVEEGIERAKAWKGLEGTDFVEKVSCQEPYEAEDSLVYGYGKPETLPPADLHMVVYDFGVKRELLRKLRLMGFRVTVVPAKTSAEDVLAMKPDGVFFAGGPGDPNTVNYGIETAKKLLGKVPVMGFGLGHLILGIACGAKAERLKFGHHGGNQPVKDLELDRTMITSECTSFSINEKSIDPKVLKVTHRNLNDGSVEGLKHLQAPMVSIQFFPDAASAPYEDESFFSRCRKLILSK